MVYDLLVNLAEHGTEEYPYSLIFPDSISFTGTMYEFKYSCGVSGGVSMNDPFQAETTTTTITTESETTTTTSTTSMIETTETTTNTTEIIEPFFMLGDCNGDGNFDVSDVVLFQKWLLNVSYTELANWKAADFCEDDERNVFDLCLMKKGLIERNKKEYPIGKESQDCVRDRCE
jgi:hypothetical protein